MPCSINSSRHSSSELWSVFPLPSYTVLYLGFTSLWQGLPWWLRWWKTLPEMQETRVQSLGRKVPLEKGMTTHFSSFAWRIPWTEEPGGLQSMGSQRVGHYKMWRAMRRPGMTITFTHLECFLFLKGYSPVFSVSQYLKIIASDVLSSLTIVYHKRETKTCYFIKAVARLQCFQTKMWLYWCLSKLGESTLNMDFKILLKDMLNLLSFWAWVCSRGWGMGPIVSDSLQVLPPSFISLAQLLEMFELWSYKGKDLFIPPPPAMSREVVILNLSILNLKPSNKKHFKPV